MSFETETIDKLYLELSHFTKAKTSKEILLEHEITMLRLAIKPFADAVNNSSGKIPTEKLSFADWHALTGAYNRYTTTDN